MNRLNALLLVSLLGNAALGYTWWCRLSDQPADIVAVTAPSTDPVVPPPPLPLVVDEQTWSRLTHADGSPLDDVTLVAVLRAEGFPADVLRTIFMQRLRQRDLAKEVALIESQPPFPYWQPRVYTGLTDEAESGLQNLGYARQLALYELLGADAESSYNRRRREREFGTLPYPKYLELQAILSDYRPLEMKVRMNSIRAPGEGEELQLLASEKRQDIEALLSPEELAAYDLRSSDESRRLQQELAEFQPSEEEYLAIHRLKSANQQDFQDPNGVFLSAEDRSKLQADNAKVEAEIAAVLGPERFAEYKIKTHYAYPAAKALTDQLGLPPENAGAVVTIQHELPDQLKAIRENPNLTPEQRTAILTTLQDTTRDRVRAQLTPAGLEAYEKSWGSWITRIVPPERPGPRTEPTP